MTKVTLTGHIVVPESDLAAVMEALPEHIALTRSEPGCLVFEVTADNENPSVFRVREEFADREAFQLHQTRMQTSRWGAVSQNVARHYVISEG